MNTLIPPPLHSRAGRPEDDLDGLLRDYFRSEMPAPWPDAPAPETLKLPAANGLAVGPLVQRPPQPAAPSWAWTSRLALAASVAGLLVGTALMSGQFHGNTPDPAKNLGEGQGNRNGPVIQESLEQPPDGPTTLRIDIF